MQRHALNSRRAALPGRQAPARQPGSQAARQPLRSAAAPTLVSRDRSARRTRVLSATSQSCSSSSSSSCSVSKQERLSRAGWPGGRQRCFTTRRRRRRSAGSARSEGVLAFQLSDSTLSCCSAVQPPMAPSSCTAVGPFTSTSSSARSWRSARSASTDAPSGSWQRRRRRAVRPGTHSRCCWDSSMPSSVRSVRWGKACNHINHDQDGSRPRHAQGRQASGERSGQAGRQAAERAPSTFALQRAGQLPCAAPDSGAACQATSPSREAGHASAWAHACGEPGCGWPAAPRRTKLATPAAPPASLLGRQGTAHAPGRAGAGSQRRRQLQQRLRRRPKPCSSLASARRRRATHGALRQQLAAKGGTGAPAVFWLPRERERARGQANRQGCSEREAQGRMAGARCNAATSMVSSADERPPAWRRSCRRTLLVAGHTPRATRWQLLNK